MCETTPKWSDTGTILHYRLTYDRELSVVHVQAEVCDWSCVC